MCSSDLDVLYRIYADYPADLEFAQRMSERSSAYLIGEAQATPHAFVEF